MHEIHFSQEKLKRLKIQSRSTKTNSVQSSSKNTCYTGGLFWALREIVLVIPPEMKDYGR